MLYHRQRRPSFSLTLAKDKLLSVANLKPRQRANNLVTDHCTKNSSLTICTFLTICFSKRAELHPWNHKHQHFSSIFHMTKMQNKQLSSLFRSRKSSPPTVNNLQVEHSQCNWLLPWCHLWWQSISRSRRCWLIFSCILSTFKADYRTFAQILHR